jgi:CHAD domain-containing protein
MHFRAVCANRPPSLPIPRNMEIAVARAAKPLRKLRKAIEAFSSKPTPDEVHDLRTGSRRVEAVIDTTILAGGRRITRSLARIRRRAGKVRDMDVLIGFATTLGGHGEEECLVQLIEELGRKRSRRARKLRKTVAKEQKLLRTWLLRSIRKLQHQENGRLNVVPAGQMADANAAALADLRKLAAWPRLNGSNLHAFRIQAKHLYYILELSSTQDSKLQRTLKDVKDVIGEWHDWNEMAEVSARVLSHSARCPAVRQIRKAAQEKFTRAMALAQSARVILTKAAAELQ